MQRVVASGFGAGLLPRAIWGSDRGAGTVGAALAAAISLALKETSVGIEAVVALFAIILSLWAARPFATGGRDPGWVCIDEVAGTLVALIGLEAWPWVAALVVARAGDITKRLPGIPWAERLPGAIGVTADDVVAGGYGLAAGWILQAFIG